MRDILFKAKRKNWKELPKEEQWVYGYYVIGLNTYEEPIHIIFEPTTIFGENGKTDRWVEIDPDTICQYTGLTDKNGNKIWENDIVRCYAVDICDREYEFVSEVYWEDCTWSLHETECCDNMLYHFDMTQNWCSHIPEIEVIGNIFDNPELLERQV